MSIKIAILDSGVKIDHPAFHSVKIKGFSLHVNEKGVYQSNDFEDHIGHGTAIFYLISTQLKKAEIYNIKIIDSHMRLKQDDLEKVLQYIYDNFYFDIINISMGLVRCGCVNKLQEICDKIHEKGTLIVSAFDNNGAISFPAALNNVVGIDSQVMPELKNDYIYIENSIVNIVGHQSRMRVAWINPDYIIVHGNSFTCANVTVQCAYQIINNGYYDIKALCKNKQVFTKKIESRLPFKINKAAVFPFNKEIHALARFENMLNFEIIDYFSTRITGQIGKRIADILPDCHNERIIKNIDSIQWDQFDTLIIGHQEKLSMLTNKKWGETILNVAIKKRKNIFCFDPIDSYIIKGTPPKNLYYPKFNENFFVKRFGKLYKSNKPILSVIGTSSQQGKFTLQLLLRKKLIQRGYYVGQLGTEPSSLLFNLDFVFPCGYNGQIRLDISQTITAINDLIWDISQKDPDIIITGGQSGLLAYNDSNALFNSFYHQLVFSAIQPDAIILCINPYDDINFIERTIKVSESLSNGKIIGIVCYPMDITEGWKGRMGSKSRISSHKILELKNKINKKLYNNIQLYMLDDDSDIDNLIDTIISFFR